MVVSAEVFSVVHQITDALLQVTNQSRDDAVARERLLLQQQQIMQHDFVEKDIKDRQILADKEKAQMQKDVKEKELLLKEKQLLAEKERNKWIRIWQKNKLRQTEK